MYATHQAMAIPAPRPRRGPRRDLSRSLLNGTLVFILFLVLETGALAHAIAGKDAAFVARTHGAAWGPFLYLGAKHMVTGYDHLLFLAGVIFFLRRFRDILLYVSLFSLGHSITLLAGTLFHFGLDPYLIDAIIGLSVAYKAFDNIGGFESFFGKRPNPRIAVFGFGLFHGLGLATKLQQLRLHEEGLLANLLAFNIGIEVGQVIALSILLALILWWRRSGYFAATALAANMAMMTAGLILIGFQLAGYFWGGAA